MRYIYGILIGVLLLALYITQHIQSVMYICDDTFGCEQIWYYKSFIEDGESRSLVIVFDDTDRKGEVTPLKYSYLDTYKTDVRYYWEWEK